MLLIFKIIVIAIILGLTYSLFKRLWQLYYKFELPPDSAFPDSKFVSIDGFNIRYIQRGSKFKPDLVLIHGICASIYSWRLIIDELSKDYLVTAFDLPGFGLSDKHPEQNYGLDEQSARILKLLDHLNIKECILVGHSMGGGIAAWMAKSNPQKITKLILIAPAIHHKFVKLNPGSWLWGIKIIKKIRVTQAMVRRVYLHVSYKFSPNNMTEVIQNYFRPYHNDPNAIVTFFKSLELLRDTRLSNGLSEINCPVLVLYADHDPIIRKNTVQKYLILNPRAYSDMILNCGHLPAEENPQLVLEKINIFLTV